jgi:hypothetical protein
MKLRSKRRRSHLFGTGTELALASPSAAVLEVEARIPRRLGPCFELFQQPKKYQRASSVMAGSWRRRRGRHPAGLGAVHRRGRPGRAVRTGFGVSAPPRSRHESRDHHWRYGAVAAGWRGSRAMKPRHPPLDSAVRVMLPRRESSVRKGSRPRAATAGAGVIAVDRKATSPAMQVAHRSHVIPMRTDPQVLNGVICRGPAHHRKKYRTRPSLPRCWRRTRPPVWRPGPDRARATQLTMNREGIAGWRRKTGLPTQPRAFCHPPPNWLRPRTASACRFSSPVMSSRGCR